MLLLKITKLQGLKAQTIYIEAYCSTNFWKLNSRDFSLKNSFGRGAKAAHPSPCKEKNPVCLCKKVIIGAVQRQGMEKTG